MSIKTVEELQGRLLELLHEAADMPSPEVLSCLMGVLVAEALERYDSNKVARLLRQGAEILERPPTSAG